MSFWVLHWFLGFEFEMWCDRWSTSNPSMETILESLLLVILVTTSAANNLFILLPCQTGTVFAPRFSERYLVKNNILWIGAFLSVAVIAECWYLRGCICRGSPRGHQWGWGNRRSLCKGPCLSEGKGVLYYGRSCNMFDQMAIVPAWAVAFWLLHHSCVMNMIILLDFSDTTRTLNRRMMVHWMPNQYMLYGFCAILTEIDCFCFGTGWCRRWSHCYPALLWCWYVP